MSSTERRISERVVHRGYGTLECKSGSESVHLVNISAKGALVALLNDHELKCGDTATLHIDLDDERTAVMNGKIAHVKNHFIGLHCAPETENDETLIQEIINEIHQLS
ncbi:hypothetical protein TDB9533_01887 [Thalassocella blandensis]|nr:hypothetical protein TDB9533_01887 [Thalassocella blandensis]